MDENRAIAALKSIGAARASRTARPDAWVPVLRELAEIVEGLTSESAARIPVLDKVFWLVVVTEGATLFAGSACNEFLRLFLAYLDAEARPELCSRAVMLLVGSMAVEIEPTTWSEWLASPPRGGVSLSADKFRRAPRPGMVTPARIAALASRSRTRADAELALRFLQVVVRESRTASSPEECNPAFAAEALAQSPALAGLVEFATQPLFISPTKSSAGSFATAVESVPGSLAAVGVRWSDGRSESVRAGSRVLPRLQLDALPGEAAPAPWRFPFLLVRELAAKCSRPTAARIAEQVSGALRANLARHALRFTAPVEVAALREQWNHFILAALPRAAAVRIPGADSSSAAHLGYDALASALFSALAPAAASAGGYAFLLTGDDAVTVMDIAFEALATSARAASAAGSAAPRAPAFLSDPAAVDAIAAAAAGADQPDPPRRLSAVLSLLFNTASRFAGHPGAAGAGGAPDSFGEPGQAGPAASIAAAGPAPAAGATAGGPAADSPGASFAALVLRIVRAALSGSSAAVADVTTASADGPNAPAAVRFLRTLDAGLLVSHAIKAASAPLPGTFAAACMQLLRLTLRTPSCGQDYVHQALARLSSSRSPQEMTDCLNLLGSLASADGSSAGDDDGRALAIWVAGLQNELGDAQQLLFEGTIDVGKRRAGGRVGDRDADDSDSESEEDSEDEDEFDYDTDEDEEAAMAIGQARSGAVRSDAPASTSLALGPGLQREDSADAAYTARRAAERRAARADPLSRSRVLVQAIRRVGCQAPVMSLLVHGLQNAPGLRPGRRPRRDGADPA